MKKSLLLPIVFAGFVSGQFVESKQLWKMVETYA